MFTRTTILENILSALRDLAPASQEINAKSDLVSDLGLESVQMMDLLMILEDKYDLSIPINILMDVSTPEELADALVACVEERHGAV